MSQSEHSKNDAELREQFRLGAKYVACRQLWFKICESDRLYKGKNSTQIANRLQLSSSTVSRWSRGDLRLEKLIAVLADCRAQWSDLEERPKNQHLRIGGYMQVFRFLYGKQLHPEGKKRLNDGEIEMLYIQISEIVCCLVALMRHQIELGTAIELTQAKELDLSELDKCVQKIVKLADRFHHEFRCSVPFDGALLEPENPGAGHVKFRSVRDVVSLYQRYRDLFEIFGDAELPWKKES